MHNTAQTTLISNGKNISLVWEFSPPHKGGGSKSRGGPPPRAATAANQRDIRLINGRLSIGTEHIPYIIA